MKFAHLADVHIGSWRDPKLNSASLIAFINAIDRCIELKVDFILISGDLFNTSLPQIDKLKEVVKKLNDVKEKGISVYLVPGSHDFSPSGKTMLDVLENASLLKNVVRGSVEDNKLHLNFTVDKKTGAKITGMLGKKGMLEKAFYESLDLDTLEREQGFKIFMFHTSLTELKPQDLQEMDSAPLSLLPKGFDYYAGGHVHVVMERAPDGYGPIIYPGPLFPTGFKEMEDLNQGGFFVYDNGTLNFQQVKLYDVISLSVDCDLKSGSEVRNLIHSLVSQIVSEIPNEQLARTIITLRLQGMLREGTFNDIGLNEFVQELYDKGAFFVMKNLAKLTTKEYEEVKLSFEKCNDVEDMLIDEHIGKIALNASQLSAGHNIQDEKKLLRELMQALDLEKQEGERVADFEKRIRENFCRTVSLK